MSGADPSPDFEARRLALHQRLVGGAYRSLLERGLHALARLGAAITLQPAPLPLWGVAVAVAALSYAVGWGVSEALGETAFVGASRARLIASAALGGGVALAGLTLTRMLTRSVCRDILEALQRERDLRVVEAFLEDWFRPHRQVIFAGVVTPILWSHFLGLTASAPGSVRGVGATIVTLTACLEASLALYWAVPILSFLGRLSQFHLRLFPLNPRDSKVIVSLRHTSIEVLYVFAALFVLITAVLSRLELLVGGQQRLALALTTWAPLLIVFMGAQRTLTLQITRAHWETLGVLQREILALTEAPGPRDQAAIDALLAQHDRLREQPTSAIDLRSALNFVNALLLPILAFVLTSWDTIIGALTRAVGITP